MALLSPETIEQMFSDLGLGSEAARERLRALAIIGQGEYPVCNFIMLDDKTDYRPRGVTDAKLA